MKRDLLSVRSGKPLGRIDDAPGAERWQGIAGDVLSGLRREVGDDNALRIVMKQGWSNGAVYFGDPTP